MDSLWKAWKDVDFLCCCDCCKFRVAARGLATAHLMRSANVAGDGGSSDNLGAREVTLGIARSHAAFEIAIGGGDSDFAGLEQSDSQTDAWSAACRQRIRAGIEQRLPDAALLGFFLDPLAGCA